MSSANVRQLAGRSERLVFVDLLRAFACLWVLYCHFHGMWLNNIRHYGWTLDTLLVRIAGFGGKGVDLFVVLSGFCLFYPTLQRQILAKPAVPVRQFWLRRMRRIFPVYFAALLCSVLLVSIPQLRAYIAPYRGLGDVLPYALLLQNHMPDYIGRINGPLWSVALECQLYLLMPIWVWMFARVGPLYSLALAAIISIVAARLGMFGYMVSGIAPFDGHGLLARVYEFVAGMAAASFVIRPQRWHLGAAIVATAVCIPTAVLLQTRYALGVMGIFAIFCWGTAFCGLVVSMGRLEERRFFHRPWLAPFAWIGLISYSIYAIHFPVMLLLKPLVTPLLTGIQATFFWATLIGIPVLIATGYALYLLVERYSVPKTRRQRLFAPATDPVIIVTPAFASIAATMPAPVPEEIATR